VTQRLPTVPGREIKQMSEMIVGAGSAGISMTNQILRRGINLDKDPDSACRLTQLVKEKG
jgi:malic enzyme